MQTASANAAMTTALFDDCLTFKPANSAERFRNFAGTVLISIYPFAWINFILEVVQIATTKDLDYESFTMRFPLVLFSIVFMGTISTLTATCLERYSLKFSSNGITFSGRGLTIRWDEIGGVACKYQPVNFGRGMHCSERHGPLPEGAMYSMAKRGFRPGRRELAQVFIMR